MNRTPRTAANRLQIKLRLQIELQVQIKLRLQSIIKLFLTRVTDTIHNLKVIIVEGDHQQMGVKLKSFID